MIFSFTYKGHFVRASILSYIYRSRAIHVLRVLWAPSNVWARCRNARIATVIHGSLGTGGTKLCLPARTCSATVRIGKRKGEGKLALAILLAQWRQLAFSLSPPPPSRPYGTAAAAPAEGVPLP